MCKNRARQASVVQVWPNSSWAGMIVGMAGTTAGEILSILKLCFSTACWICCTSRWHYTRKHVQLRVPQVNILSYVINTLSNIARPFTSVLNHPSPREEQQIVLTVLISACHSTCLFSASTNSRKRTDFSTHFPLSSHPQFLASFLVHKKIPTHE